MDVKSGISYALLIESVYVPHNLLVFDDPAHPTKVYKGDKGVNVKAWPKPPRAMVLQVKQNNDRHLHISGAIVAEILKSLNTCEFKAAITSSRDQAA
ncbi:hypothetical protein Tco_1533042 [Tanacetum coccineum]